MPLTIRERKVIMRGHDFRMAHFRTPRSLRDAGIVDIRRAENRGEWWMSLLVATVCGGIILWAVMHA